MTTLTANDINLVLTLLGAARENLDRIEKKLRPSESQPGDDLDPGNPLNKIGDNLSPRGVEVCYRLYDQGKTRYAVSQALKISYGAATHRFHAWEKLGGVNRQRQPLE
ncbi:hypothetical protein [Sphingobium indicum]|uniref:Uncharacterized protein n=1 Tax=Sphingobium indicum (strain DSM 16412 / CCM 7286 / MTCC 6364 / B90A) TaxID=861109 RepID=A0A1L5BRT9_SPHIB|nr:hypothetical protein [Sphingobium indicum]APL95497.1 hypothetical protein SIDU_13795 [Sphingobium indicum B90A]